MDTSSTGKTRLDPLITWFKQTPPPLEKSIDVDDIRRLQQSCSQ